MRFTAAACRSHEESTAAACRSHGEGMNVTSVQAAQLATHFDRRAETYGEKYDACTPRHLFELEKQQRLIWTLKWLERHTHTRPSGRLLDVGCGNGRLICTWLGNTPCWKAVGVDVSAGMIAQSLREAARTGVADRSRWIVGQTEQLTGSFDAVTSLGVIGYQKDQLAFARSLANRVAASGLLILSFGNRHSVLRKVRQAIQRTRRTLNRETRDIAFRSESLARLNEHLQPRGFRQLDGRWLGFGLGFSRWGQREAQFSHALERRWSHRWFARFLAQVGLAAFVREA